MIKAEYDNEKHGVRCKIDCHCVPQLKAELLFLIHSCFENEPEATLDTIEDFMHILSKNLKNENNDKA